MGLKLLKIKSIKNREKMGEERKQEKKKKDNSTELQKPNVEAEIYNNSKKCDSIYTYTFTSISKINSQTKIKYNRLTQ